MLNKAVEEIFDQLLANERSSTAQHGKEIDFSFLDIEAKISANITSSDTNINNFQIICNPKVTF